jgi:multicomponent Na+:H+ antiporter subunit C
MKAGETMSIINGAHISIVLFFIGLFGLIARRQIVKTIISIGIMEGAVILFFLSIGRWQEQVPPIGGAAVEQMADPLPQALMITAIVIGVAITAATLTLYLSLHHQHGTTDWVKAQLLNEQSAMGLSATEIGLPKAAMDLQGEGQAEYQDEEQYDV